MSARDQVNAQFRVARWMGDEALVPCPHPDHDDQNPSASINVAKRVWVCYSCGQGGSLERLLGKRVADPAVEDLLTELSTTLAGFDSPDHGYPESWLDQFDVGGVHPYWTRRGISEAACRTFRLGYDPDTQMATYPLRGPTGAVLGVVRRATDNFTLPKYRYPDHSPISKTLFGYHLVRHGVPNNVVLTEGALDAVAMWDAGLPAVAQLGAHLSHDQIGLLRKLAPRSITIAYDQDHAGEKALNRVLNNRSIDFCQLHVMEWDPVLGKDPLDLSVEERYRQWERARLAVL